MAQHSRAQTRICPDCDGFPIVAIDTGALLADGTRATLDAICRRCHGTGRVHVLAPAAVGHQERA
ncbi:hypothetical protein ACWCXB_02680 [Streptomyces sp. NPDC001514]